MSVGSDTWFKPPEGSDLAGSLEDAHSRQRANRSARLRRGIRLDSGGFNIFQFFDVCSRAAANTSSSDARRGVIETSLPPLLWISATALSTSLSSRRTRRNPLGV